MSININMAVRASESANEYAQKKKEQLEASKRLREERKQASLLKNVGEQFVLKPSNSGNNANGGGMLLSTSSSGFSQKSNNSGGNNGMQGNNGARGMQQPNGQAYQGQYQNGMSTSASMGYQNSNGYNNGGYPQNQYQMNSSHMNHLTPGTGTKTQENYYNPQTYSQNQRGNGSNSYSIQYDEMTTPNGQNYHQGATTFSGGFQRNSQNLGASPQQYSQPPSATQQQFRSTRNTSSNNTTNGNNGVGAYSRQELEVARSNLKLLKMRMSSQKKPSYGGVMGNSEEGGYGARNGYDMEKRPFNYDENTGPSGSGYNNRSQNNGQPSIGGRPPSGRRMNNQTNDNQYQNSNFRKAFVPSFQSDSQVMDSVNDIVLGGNPKNQHSQPKSNSYGGNEPSGSSYKPQNNGGNSRFDPDSHTSGKNIPSYSGKPNYSQSKYQDEEEEEDQRNTYKQKPKQQPNSKKPSNIKHRDYDEQEEEPVSKEQEQKKLLSIYENAGDDQDAFEGAVDDGERIECSTCGRKFAEEALMKHSKICKKVFVQKRKIFDVKKVRQEAIQQEMKDSDPYSYKPTNKAAPKKAPSATEKPVGGGSKAGKWKAQSEMFRAAMRANRTNDDDEAGQAAQQALVQAMEQNDDRVECKWCNRKFNGHAADRHIPVCEKKYKENQMKGKGGAKGGVANKTGIGFKK